jgi:hypothetical protein
MQLSPTFEVKAAHYKQITEIANFSSLGLFLKQLDPG